MASSSDDQARLGRLYAAINELGTTPFTLTAYRHPAPGRDPLSGTGAQLVGGRWNPPGVPTVYLADSVEACVGEFLRMAEGQGRGPDSFLPRHLHTIELNNVELVDLTATGALDTVGLVTDDIGSKAWEPCQTVGAAVEVLGYAGLVALSATGLGRVIALFDPRIGYRRVVHVATVPMEEPPVGWGC